MFWLIWWLLFGLLTGFLARWFHPSETDGGFTGWGGSLALGVAGSYIGGLISYLLFGTQMAPSGVILGVIGGVLLIYLVEYLKSKKFL